MTNIRTDWSRDEIAALFDLPFTELLFQAATVHREFHPPEQVQLCTLLSIKTGGCPEDCGYCSQSVKADSGVEATKLMEVQSVLQRAAQAKDAGSQRFCMGAAWRQPKDSDLVDICAMVEGVKALGLESCATLGMLSEDQAERLKRAGLDYYNHNLDTSPEYYGKVVSTRTYDDRLETLGRARTAGLKLCCGGILGMGESREDRIGLIHELSKLTPHPESVPVNMLVPIEGTPLGYSPAISVIEMARAIAVCRVVFPQSWVRLSAGREGMTEEGQALCLLAGANSIFVGDRLLTTDNPEIDEDDALMGQMGLEAAGRAEMEAPARRTTLIGG